MVLRDGRKFACESCIKGHRVSSCQHEDRPLREIARKGRPVKQCEHCRGARKANSHHTKCDCNLKKDKAAQIKLPDVELFGQVSPDDLLSPLDEHSCTCYSSTKCTCGSVKREPIDLTSPPIQHPFPRPPLIATQSETHLVTVKEGHDPRHRFYAPQGKAPYQIPHRPGGHKRTCTVASVHNNSNVSNAGLPVPNRRTLDDIHLLGGPYNNLETSRYDSMPTFVDNRWLTLTPQEQASNLPYMNSASYTQSMPTNINEVRTKQYQVPWIPPYSSAGQQVASIYSSSNLVTSLDEWNTNFEYLNNFAGSFDSSFSAGDLPLDANKVLNPMPVPSNSGDSINYSVTDFTTSSYTQSETGGEFGFLNDLNADCAPLERVSTNTTGSQSYYDTYQEWPPASSPSDEEDGGDIIEPWRTETIKPPKSQTQPISITIPTNSVSPPSEYSYSASQYASAAASGQTSPVFGDMWSQPPSATGYSFQGNDIDPLALSSSLENVNGYESNDIIDWNDILQNGGDWKSADAQPQHHNGMQGMSSNNGAWLTNQQ